MAQIGTLGTMVFSVSHNQVRTFSGMKLESSAKYATHDRHLKLPLLEYTGTGLDKLSFSMYFSWFTGTDPEEELKKLEAMLKSGKAVKLIIGGKLYGSYRWVIQTLSKELERFDNKGGLLSAKVNITLLEYAKR